MDNRTIQLPSSFLFGAASAAHQVEGDNKHNNWWHAEQSGKVATSGKSADHYNRYAEDFRLAREIGLNAMRLSIEWSRIEPEQDHWNAEAVEHYRDVLAELKKLGMTRMVTLFHFTLPQWLAEQGGLETTFGVKRFAQFSAFIAEQLGSEIDLWVTVNEPEVYTLLSYWRGMWPPFVKSAWRSMRMIRQLIAAHNEAAQAIKKVLPQAQIGLAKNNVYYEPYRKHNVLDRLAVWVSRSLGNNYILNKTAAHSDFIGINYYFYQTLKFSFLRGADVKNSDGPKSDMGWRTYPIGLYHLIKDVQHFGKPVYITENGIANARDDMRQRFIEEHLQAIEKADGEGCDVRGYFYWALTDTYEWHDGYNPKFGLVEVNFETQERTVRNSADIFKAK